ncbi:hypothetical protein TNCV_2875771 [Trichonephila clavipes]|nr:hypothetical protein TNCV_2875771 [Trichonephila clavipes]
MTVKDILEFVQSSKNIIDANSDNENEMNNSAPVPMSSKMRNIMKKEMDLVPKMPAFMNKQAQLSIEDANETRLVISIRWVEVESFK